MSKFRKCLHRQKDGRTDRRLFYRILPANTGCPNRKVKAQFAKFFYLLLVYWDFKTTVFGTNTYVHEKQKLSTYPTVLCRVGGVFAVSFNSSLNSRWVFVHIVIPRHLFRGQKATISGFQDWKTTAMSFCGILTLMLLIKCPCGQRFNITHAMNYKRRVLLSWDKDIREFEANLLKKGM